MSGIWPGQARVLDPLFLSHEGARVNRPVTEEAATTSPNDHSYNIECPLKKKIENQISKFEV